MQLQNVVTCHARRMLTRNAILCRYQLFGRQKGIAVSLLAGISILRLYWRCCSLRLGKVWPHYTAVALLACSQNLSRSSCL